MRTASLALIALLNSADQLLAADLLTLTLADGSIVRFTNSDHDVSANGNTFPSNGPPWTHGTITTSVGLATDTMDLTFYPDNSQHALASQPWPAAAASGVLDGARVVVERAFMAQWTDSAETFILFSGVVSQVQPTRNTIAVTVSSDMELLTQPLPRNLWQPGCVHTLYDAGCTLVKGAAGLTLTGTLVDGSTATALLATDADAPATGFFDLGSMRFSTGANAGVEFTIQSYVNAAGALTFVPVVTLPHAPAAGDAFTAYAGCDKSQATCASKFSNSAHFRGFPYVPVPLTMR